MLIELRSAGVVEGTCKREDIPGTLPVVLIVQDRVYMLMDTAEEDVEGTDPALCVYERTGDFVNFDIIAREKRGPFGGPFSWNL